MTTIVLCYVFVMAVITVGVAARENVYAGDDAYAGFAAREHADEDLYPPIARVSRRVIEEEDFQILESVQEIDQEQVLLDYPVINRPKPVMPSKPGLPGRSEPCETIFKTRSFKKATINGKRYTFPVIQVLSTGTCKRGSSCCSTGTCSQEYRLISLVAEGGTNGKLKPLYLRIKSHCACKNVFFGTPAFMNNA